MSRHNKNFYSLKELKRARDCYKGYLDGKEVYYFVGALRFACDEIERLHSIIKEVREYGKEVLSWTTNEPITDEIGEHILEIVDKENRE